MQKILEGMASSTHSHELMLLDICDLATLIRTCGSCESMGSHTQRGLGQTKMFHFDKAVLSELSSKHTEKPNGKILFSLNIEVMLDKSLGTKQSFAKKRRLLKLNYLKVLEDQS